MRLPVDATIGESRIDLVGSDLRMTGQPEDVPPLARGMIPEVEQRGYRAYPLVDHVADKIAATYERHGEERRPSTRYRDLVDLVAIVSGACVEAAAQRAALTSEFDRRGLTLPTSFDIPDRALWEPGYAAEARRSLLDTAQTLEEALAVVRPFIDPLFDGTASGSWEPGSRRWG
ncbi:MAG: nucleotidyl transferase AbiEii/AbiGii toxin family protein [Acidimicrobiales bacterium]